MARRTARRHHGGMTQTLPPPDAATYVPPANDESRQDASASSRLVRPRDGRVLGGVCAGIADRFGWDRTLVRVLTVLSILIPGPQVLAYLIAWIAIPDEADGEPIIAVDMDKAVGDVKRVGKN